jgi:L-asparaginase
MAKPRILVVALGGTISMTPTAGGGITPKLTGADLVAAVPELEKVAQVDPRSPFQLPGASLTIGQLAEVAALIDAEIARGASGAVVVQGTDTIEETAFLMDCLVQSDRPVVVTGAMRGPQAPGAEGPANLLAAVTVAAQAEPGRGAVVVLNDEVHSARFVQKGHTGLPSAFTSRPYGPVGHVIEGRYVEAMRVCPLQKRPLAPVADAPPVALLHIGLGDDGRLLGALPGLGCKGAVLVAMGAGHVPMTMVEPVATLAQMMPVVLTSRINAGPVFANTYGFAGSEIDLLGRGVIHGAELGPLKARLLLQLLLAGGVERADLAEAIARA